MTCVELKKRTDEFRETGQTVKFPLKNRDLLIASKVRSICFRKFYWLPPRKLSLRRFLLHFLRLKSGIKHKTVILTFLYWGG